MGQSHHSWQREAGNKEYSGYFGSNKVVFGFQSGLFGSSALEFHGTNRTVQVAGSTTMITFH